MAEPGELVVTIIVDSEDHATRMAETLVEERLVATANVQRAHIAYRLKDGVLSAYREYAIRATTTTTRFDALIERVAGLPGIILPGVTAERLTAAHPRFEPWLRQVLETCGG